MLVGGEVGAQRVFPVGRKLRPLEGGADARQFVRVKQQAAGWGGRGDRGVHDG